MSDLIESLRGTGRHHSFGTFSLDRKKAQEKMREFQLVNPCEYVLHLVAAGVAGGATRIEVALEGRDIAVRLQDLTLPREIFEQPLCGLFIAKERADLDAWRHFSISLNAVFALRPREVLVQSGEQAVVVDPQGGTVAAPALAPASDTHVRVSGRWSWRQLLRVFGVGREEEALLRDRACLSPIPVWVNGREISQAGWEASALHMAQAEGAVVTESFSEGDMHALLWLDRRLDPVSTRFYVCHGILVTSMVAALPPVQPDAVVYCDSLVTNASESGIVEEGHLQGVEAFLGRTTAKMASRACEVFMSDPLMRSWLRPRLLHAAAAMLAYESDWSTPPKSDLARLPLFTDCEGAPMTLLEMHGAVLAHGPLCYLDATLSGRLPQRHRVVRVEGEADVAALAGVFGSRVGPLAEPADLRMRNVNMARWRALPRHSHISATRCAVTVRLEDDAFQGELGLPLDDSRVGNTFSELTILAGGRQICLRRSRGVLRYVAVLDHEDLSINVRWDDVEEDEVFERGQQVLARAYERACQRLAEMVAAAPQPAGDRVLTEHVLRFLRQRSDTRGQASADWAMGLKIIPTVSGTACSLADLRAEAARGPLGYVYDMWGGQMDDRIVVNLMKGDSLLDLEVLNKLVPGKWVNRTRRLQSERLTVRLRARPECKPAISGAALFPTPFKNREIFGVVGLNLGGGPSRVTFIRKARRIEVRTMYLGADPLEVAVDSPFLQADEEATRVLAGEPVDRVTRVVDIACADLARTVALAWPAAVGQARARMRRFLLAWIELHPGDAMVRGEVDSCPLLRAVGGAFVTLSQIRELAHRDKMVPWVPIRQGGGEAPSRVVLALEEDELRVLRVVFGSCLQDWSDGLWRERIQSPPSPSPSPPSPRAAARTLLRGVAAAFRTMALKQQYDWKVDVFGRVSAVSARQRKDLVYLDGTLCFNLEHPLAIRLLQRPTSPDHVAWLASVLFTVYNQAQEDVTDEDEVRFMAELLLWHAEMGGQV